VRRLWRSPTRTSATRSRRPASALADARELSVISRLGWIAVAVAAVAATAGARWGLPGVISGVGLGWLVRSCTALSMTARHLRLPAAAPAVPS
jgi:hypothetical protein